MTSNRDPAVTGSDRWAYGLAAVLAGAGVVHLVAPGVYVETVPRIVPGSAMGWTIGSGIAELACAALVTVPRTRRLGGTLTAVLFVVVFPANVQMAVDWRHRAGLAPVIAYARLPLQVPLVLWAWHVRRRASTPRCSPARRRPG